MNDRPIDRRLFLSRAGSVLGGLWLGAPAARAAGRVLATLPPETSAERSLILIQLTGGNDSTSTVVPYADDAYHASRSSSRIEEHEVLRLDDYRGLHPALVRLRKVWERGQLAIVEGAGYPESVRSHFEALEVWHTGRPGGRATGPGWVGRLAQEAWADHTEPELLVHVGGFAPYSMRSPDHPPIALDSPPGYRWFGAAHAGTNAGAGHDTPPEAAHPSGRDAALARLRAIAGNADSSSDRVRNAALAYRAHTEFPSGAFGAALRDIAALLHGGLGTRVFSVTLGGFDTHAAQRADHDGLMRTLDAGLGALMQELSLSEQGRKTVVLVFSEFGRRLEENSSRGHDHGKAGTMFVLGTPVRGGLYGEHPSLTKLDDGDLAVRIDFRSVYAEIIERWFGVARERVLGKTVKRVALLR